MSLSRLLLIMVLFATLSFAAPVLAQTNPDPAACGLPAVGTITIEKTYTLTADCT